jgi:hypothetical protein
MAHFYATISGNRSERTCMGTKNSGLTGHLRGWDVGVLVNIVHNEEEGVDIVRLYKTGGSNDPSPKELVAEYREEIK